MSFNIDNSKNFKSFNKGPLTGTQIDDVINEQILEEET